MLIQPPNLPEIKTTSQITTCCGLKYSAGKQDTREPTLTTTSNVYHILIKYKFLCAYQRPQDLFLLQTAGRCLLPEMHLS